MVAFGLRGPLNYLLSEAAHLWTKLRVFSAQTGLTRMVEIVLDPETKRLATRAAAGLGVMAVVAVGLPQLQARAEQQADDHEWRLKAQAFVEFDEEASSVDPAVARLAAFHSADDAVNDRAAVSPFQTFSPVHFKTAEEQHVNVDCLSRAIYYEARSESRRGQLAVAEVVLNRVSHRLYPNNICGVVYEGTDRETGLSWRGNQESCQFSFTCDGSEARRPPVGEEWQVAQRVAAHALMGLSTSVTGYATHYHANYVSPYWAPRLVHTQTIGTHIFYRFPLSAEERGRRGA
jgi:spore germination cell wall hydrolase CwlJ-like protein